MPIDLSSLNINQKKAVLWNDGALLVLAGPGSGKTRVLTLRVARLLEEQEDASVLALTFTNKAAAEMRERVDHLLGQRGDRAHLCTFHSYATDVLRQHGSHIGLQPDFALLTQDEDRIAVLDPVAIKLREEGHQIPRDQKNLLSLLDHLFKESYNGGSVAPGLASTPSWVPRLFTAYCDALIAANRLDFGSLLSLTCKLLRDKPGVARVMRIGWTHICVDEFQDSNKAQYDLLRLMVDEKHPNLFVVGDDDQIMYQWNGASPERLQELRSDYNMDLVQLPENYRCPPEIVALANNLIAHNKMRTSGKKPLAAKRPPSTHDSVIRYQEFDSPEDEASFVAKDISTRGAESSGCAVLARTTKALGATSEAIQSVGLVPYLAKRKTDFESAVVRVALGSFRLANARHDRDALRRLCLAWDKLSGGSTEVENVVATATLVGGDFLRAWSDVVMPNADARSLVLINKLRGALVDRLEFPGIVDWFFSEGVLPWKDTQDVDLHEELSIWSEFHQSFIREHGIGGATLNAYLQSLDLASKVPPAPVGAIHCLTVHGAKGLEFKHVYLIGMSQDVMPSFQALKKGPSSREIEEERRNCFVAITRAKESLTITRSRSYHGYSKDPSQFLSEMAGGIDPA